MRPRARPACPGVTIVETLDPDDREAIDTSAILAAFCTSAEFAGLAPRDRELVWVSELLDSMSGADWTWDDLDLAGLTATLFEGMPWSIERAPDDPAGTARLLDAFLRFAGREYRAPHAAACSAYLSSPWGIAEIGRRLKPLELADDEHWWASLSSRR